MLHGNRKSIVGSTLVGALVTGLFWASVEEAGAARVPVRRRSGAGEASETAQADYRANDLLRRGLEFLAQAQEERGLSMLTSIPRMFPESKVRFDAYLAIGKYYADKRQYDLAIRQFRQVEASEDESQQAEALYQTGICFYNLSSYDRAFTALRRVTSDFPGSVFANEAYYYIGQCHFKLGRWARAVEALKMVGTSVPLELDGQRLAEAGQRLFVKVHDMDLVVLNVEENPLTVEFMTASGDREIVGMEPLGRAGDYYIASIQTEPGTAKPGDGILQIRGLEKVTVRYVDENTETGERQVARQEEILMVSSASVGFTDGAFREYVQGVFAESDSFIRVRDLDRNLTDKPDEIVVRVLTRYTVKKDEDEEAIRRGIDLADTGEAKVEVRDTLQVKLTETGPDTGIFVGSIVPQVINEGEPVDQADGVLSAVQGDEIVIEYWDEHHLQGGSPRLVTYAAKVLVGEIQDVKIIHRVVDSPELRARKNLIEAKIFLRLGGIFKDVGLIEQARDKANQGLERADDVISTSLRASLSRELVEEAFMVKWELLLVQDKLNEAIGVCQTLTRLFPDSSLVDQALLKIGVAKMQGEDPQEAIPIFSGILRLAKSDLKAEAQYNIARVYEQVATREAERRGVAPDLSRALLAYQQCSETYPESPFAGESLDKIVNFYITARDYSRAVEIMERVFVDYPDASFLDNMLLKWVIASYRMGNFQVAHQKASQLLSEYPNSEYAPRAKQFMEVIEKRL